MSELQADDTGVIYDSGVTENDAAEEETGLVETEQQDEQRGEPASELAPEEHEKTRFSEDQQRIVDEIVAKKTYKLRETERQAEELKRKLAELEAKIPKEREPEIPALPDAWDDDYAEKMAQRDQAIQRRAAYDAKQAALREQQIALEQQTLANRQREYVETVTAYSERAKKLGVSAEDLAKAGQTVATFGVSEDIANYILTDDQGPLITTYLGRNLAELEKLTKMSPMKAAAYIENVVRKNAAVSGKKTTRAPAPVEPLRGGGAKTDHPALDGVIFE